ncbi:MAG: orotate phosphoribosyltransferase [Clostridiales bacterium]|jgi:orotate phosphoribosyltransferase|nr:orotate phosphoribosyltransferase [Clostridiales bacterium]
MNREQLARAIYDASHITGEFLLRSGQISNEYFDKYMFTSDPVLLAAIAEGLAALVPDGTEVIAGLEMGAIPLAAALSGRTGLPAAYVRKTAKEYGTRRLSEGASVAGKRVCVIEDVVTTGGQILQSVPALRELGADIDTVLCVIQRNPGAGEILAEQGLKLLPLFTMEYIKSLYCGQ